MSSSSSSPPQPTQKDLDCAFLARDALFPLKIQRDGSHPTQFPAAEAAAKMRQDATEHHGNRVASSFFPRRVVVVHDVNDATGLQWNGQPDIDNGTASFDVIPQLLSVTCRVCGGGGGGGGANKQQQAAYVQKKDDGERQIVLCSDKLLRRDYTSSRVPDQTPQSLVAVETTLAHHVSKVGFQVERERTSDTSTSTVAGTAVDSSTKDNDNTDTSCLDAAAMEVVAARAAECYYSQTKGAWGQKAAYEIKRGPELGHAGFSWYPEGLRRMLQDRCVRAVAKRAAAPECESSRQASECVAKAMSQQSGE